MSTRSLLVSVGLVVVMLGLLSFLQKQVPGTERMAKESKRITDLPVRETPNSGRLSAGWRMEDC